MYYLFFEYAIRELDFPEAFQLSVILLIAVFIFYLSSFFTRELIKVDHRSLSYKKLLFGFTRKQIDLNSTDIIELAYKGFDEWSEHPLETENDSLGFGIAQKEAQFLSSSGTILLKTKRKDYTFGKDLISDDAMEIIELIDKTLHNN